MNTAPNQKTNPDVRLEAVEAGMASISWRGIFAGAFVALLVYMALLSLGLAVGGGNLQGVIQGEGSFGGLGIGAGIWMIVSTIIALFAGAYAASRVSGLIPIRIGRVQGLVITALFFAVVFSQLGMAIGLVGQGIGQVAGAAGQAASQLGHTDLAQNVISQQLKGLNLKSPPQAVAQGIASRLVQGDVNGAKNYLAKEAGISRAQADQKIESIRQGFEQGAKQAGIAAAKVTKAVGWTLFGAIVLGGIAAMIGGGIGSGINLRRPLSGSDLRAASR